MNNDSRGRSDSTGEKESRTGKVNPLCDCGTVSRNGTGVDDKCNRLGVIEMVSVLDPDAWVSRDVHSLYGMFHVWECYEARVRL